MSSHDGEAITFAHGDLNIPISSWTPTKPEEVSSNGVDAYEAATPEIATAQATGSSVAATPAKASAKRKTPVKKGIAKRVSKNAEAVKDGEDVEDEDQDPKTPTPAKKRRAVKPRAKKSEEKVNEDDEGAASGDEASLPTAGSSTKKRVSMGSGETSAKKQKVVKTDANGDEAEASAKKAPVKRTPKTPKVAKAPKAAATPGTKGKPTSFPETAADMSVADKLLIRLRNDEKKDWNEINAAWNELTGTVAGTDVLRKRLPKLLALVNWKAGDERKLIEFKAIVEAEKWSKIAAMFKEIGSVYTATSLQLKYDVILKKGDVTPDGKYIGSDIAEEAEEGFGLGGDVEGDVKMEDGDVDADVHADTDGMADAEYDMVELDAEGA